ncbi:MAG: InlB B-repeat-containing protein, partial [Oscillospiraceae bacterium]|nr:InlB B-repeat-containing protein [Oscillospiraceae bacterium]
ILSPGEEIAATADVTLTALWRQIGPWEALQLQIDAAEDGVETTITLTEDVTATEEDTALRIPGGKIVTLDLDGHTLDRGLSGDNMEAEGCVLVVCSGATLSMTGGSTGGTVTGGGNTGSGGGIYVEAGAVLDLTNIAVSGNYCTDHGAGIYLADNAQCSVVNSSVDSNRTTVGSNGSGGGIYFSGGTLQMTDCSISDNRSKNLGGGLYIASGSVELTGCEIDRNDAYANACGGGVFLSGGSLRLDGCEVSGNTSSKNDPHGIGVFVNNAATFTVSGETKITNNCFGNRQLNVFLHNGAVIRPDDLADTAIIGVAVGRTNSSYIAEYRPGVVTDGLPGNGTAANFTSDISRYLVGLYQSGEAFLGPPMTVSFASGDDGATGTMDDVPVAKGSVYTLPACGFAVVGKIFAGWRIGSDTGDLKQPGDTITVSASITVTAVWEDDPTTVVVSFDACGGTAVPAKVEIEIGASIGELPTPTRAGGWVFLGWYTEPAATQYQIGQSTAVTAETVFEEDATVYAHWRLPGDVNGDGTVTVADVTLLAKYVKARGQGVTLVPGSGNVDGSSDGKITVSDVTLLAKYVKARGVGVEIH